MVTPITETSQKANKVLYHKNCLVAISWIVKQQAIKMLKIIFLFSMVILFWLYQTQLVLAGGFFVPVLNFISANIGKYLLVVIMLYVEIFNPFKFPHGTYIRSVKVSDFAFLLFYYLCWSSRKSENLISR